MQKGKIHTIVQQYSQRTVPDSVRQKFQWWMIQPVDEDEKEKALLELWHSTNTQADESTLQHLDEIHAKINISEQKNSRRVYLNRFKRIAAIIVLPLVCSLLTYYLTNLNNPGNVELVECFAGNGEYKEVLLPDGSKVEINSGSLLIYPDKFTGETRTIFLKGEANFSVTPDKNKPFIVKTQHVAVQALGTVFNVQAYADLPRTIATLEEGRIKVDIRQKEQSYIVDPNEQVIYDNLTGESFKQSVDAKRVTMWRDGYMVFQSASFDEIVHGIERKFNVAVHFDTQKYKGRSITVRFSPDETLHETFGILKFIVNGLDYEIKENNVYIY